ncbi:MAG TPA: hypothetical protein VNR36_01175 [Pseudolysinimonas sp.]|nr:hypothetical protein [Pseudolysinimonas sp.]
MRLVSYAGGNFVTSDVVADALLDYAAALGNAHHAAAIVVPAVGLGQIRLLVGPASQLLSVPVQDTRNEPDGAEFTADIEARIAQMRGWES